MKEHIAGASVNAPFYKIPIPDEYYHKSNNTSPQGRKANAVFVILGDTTGYLNDSLLMMVCAARNSDINGIMFSMKQMEDRFNKKFQYDYVFLNEQPFDQRFKEWVSLVNRDIRLQS